MQNNNCPLADDTKKTELSNIKEYQCHRSLCSSEKKNGSCYRCLGKGHANKDCKVHPYGINECTTKLNRLLHSENRMNESSHAVTVSAATINKSNQVISFFQLVPVSVQRGW